MNYTLINRKDAYKIGFGVDAPQSLTDPFRLIIYGDLSELQCTIKDVGYVYSKEEYSTQRQDGTYRNVLYDDVVANGYLITYNMMGHGEQIPQKRGRALDNPLPTPQADNYMFNGWFLNSGLTAKAVEGAVINSDITLYAKWVEAKLTFGLMDGGSSSVIDITSISSITLNNIVYSDSNLSNHYDSTTKKFIFTGFTDSSITYSVINKTNSAYRDISNMIQTFESLNNNNILLYKKTTTIGDFTVTCNWNGDASYIFDVYSLAYKGQAPYADETGTSEYTKLLETSFSTDNDWYHIPKGVETNGFKLHYDTKGGQSSWSMGEFTTVKLDSGYSLEELFRNYSFVFIVNDYGGGEPGKSNKTKSNFATKATGMTINIQIGNFNKTIKLAQPSETKQEIPPEFANWIVFRTKLLGKDEEFAPDLHNVIEELNKDGYSYFDGSNMQKTLVYDLQSGGRGYV